MEVLQEKNYSIESFKLKYKCASPPPKRDILSSPDKVVAMTRGIFNELDGGSSVEHFGVCFLNVQNELIGFKAFNTGTVDQVAVYPRMILHTALMVGASGMVLIHNHPSGYAEPSEEDRRLTRSIKDAGRLLDVRLLDHLIIGADIHYSFLERGIL